MEENENIKPTQAVQPMSKADIMAAIRNDFTTSVKPVYVNSLKKEVGFREITVREQKSLSRIMIENEHRKDVVYDTQCQLINQVCLDKDFDIYQATEFDKIKLMMALYQSNMFKNEIKFTCRECKTENIYRLEFAKVLERLDQFDLSDKVFEFENDQWKFVFTINYPTVQRVSQFYRQYAQQYRQAGRDGAEQLNNVINMDYIGTFIKAVKMTNKNNGNVRDVDLTKFRPDEATEVISFFPQDVMYNDDGVMQFIANDFVKRINDAFEKHKCVSCGHEYEDAIDKDTAGFF